MKILFLESFFGGSHRDFALGLKENSSHEIDIVSLPARNWKWRMVGAALEFSRQIKNITKYDLIFATGMINLAEFKAFAHIKSVPVILYFHETQITYPLSSWQKIDLQLAYINIISAIMAKKVFFNSKFQLDEFFIKIDKLLAIIPDLKPEWIKDEIFKKTSFLYPGCRFPKTLPILDKLNTEKPLIIWNHRWEWDKNPDEFFWALKLIKQKKIPFELALLGEQPDTLPDIFIKAKHQFSDEIISYGYIESKQEYISLLKKGAIVVSTAIQENFGVSVIEAVRMGCIPLLPNRLSYPEIMPKEYLNEILYSGKKDFVTKLENLLLNYQEYNGLREQLSSSMEKYSWEALIKNFDMEFEKFIGI